jgi:hypothetical protein
MGSPSDPDDDANDLLNLIAQVHGDVQPQQQALERALGVLEGGHRHAAAAMQRFERTGQTVPRRVSEPQGPNAPTTPAGAPEPTPAPHAGQAEAPTTVMPRPHAEVTQMYWQAPPAAASGRRHPELDIAGAPEAAPSAGPQPEPDKATAQAPGAAEAEVLAGRGAEFIDRGRTQTHITAHRKPRRR